MRPGDGGCAACTQGRREQTYAGSAVGQGIDRDLPAAFGDGALVGKGRVPAQAEGVGRGLHC